MPDGGRVSISAGGVLLGRAPDSDVILTDERASRRHALVFMADERPHIVPLGKGPTEVDEERLAGERPLTPGGAVSMPGLRLTVEVAEPVEPVPVGEWVLQVIGGGLYGVAQSPFTVGGGRDNLHFDGWPSTALTFWRAAGRLSVEAGVQICVDGQDVGPGHIVGCRSGTRIECAGSRLQILIGDRALASTAADDDVPYAGGLQAVRLVFLPRGARLYLTDRHSERAVYLPERRADLVSLLLQPPSDYQPGDLIPDELLLQRIWPRQTKVVNDVHVLVHRVRKSLVAAGIDGPSLIERDAEGGGTRFAVAPGAMITVE